MTIEVSRGHGGSILPGYRNGRPEDQSKSCMNMHVSGLDYRFKREKSSATISSHGSTLDGCICTTKCKGHLDPTCSFETLSACLNYSWGSLHRSTLAQMLFTRISDDLATGILHAGI